MEKAAPFWKSKIFLGGVVVAVLLFIFIISSSVFRTGYMVKTETVKTPCSDECFTYGRYCEGNNIYSCSDIDADGCKEKTYVTSCASNEVCSNGYCERKTYCGDSICQSNENCDSCPQDCGQCITVVIPSKKSLGSSCSYNNECESDYCVHNICRSSSTYCGDGYCDSGESCSSCLVDCGTCDIFTVGKAYAGSSEKISETGDNKFKIIGQTQVGQAIPSITIPLQFNVPTRDVTYNFYCSGTGGYSFFAESKPSPNDPEQWVILSQGGVSFASYFGYGSADPFILTNKQDFGAHISYTGKGGVRIILFLDSFPDEDMTLKCQFSIVSTDPPFRRTTSIELTHIR